MAKRKKNPSEDDSQNALLDTFGDRYREQSEFRRGLLRRDVLELWEEEGGDDELSLWDAAKELRRRIGGDRNLTAYLDSLEAGARHKGVRSNPMAAWDVYLNGKRIDRVFFEEHMNNGQVRRSLIEHDGYDPGITVRRGRKVKPNQGGSSVGQTILEQLGGARFAVMTGARAFVSGPDNLSFRITRARQGINVVRITLTPADTYTMAFLRLRGSALTLLKKYEDVYADQLRGVFTDATGLETSLGTMGRNPRRRAKRHR